MVGVTGLIVGGGSDGTLAALPTPEGSLIEPLSPLTFAGPGGMPLTPASWARDGAASSAASAPASKTILTPVRLSMRSELAWAYAIGASIRSMRV